MNYKLTLSDTQHLENRKDVVRRQRNKKLQQSDYTQLSDSPLSESKKAEWVLYRQLLRDLPSTIISLNPDKTITFSWPQEPSQAYRINYAHQNGTTYHSITADTQVRQNAQWNHLAFTRDANGTGVKVYLNGEVLAHGTTATETITINIAADHTSYVVNFDVATFNIGDILGLSMTPSTTPGDTIITSVWEFDFAS